MHLRYSCNRDWTKIGGRIPWNVTSTCEICRTDCLMGKHHTKDDLVNHLKGPSSRLVHWLNIISYPRKIGQESINLVRKNSEESSLVMYCTRRESGKETNWLWTLRSWKRWTHRKFMLKDSMLKRWSCLKVVITANSQSQMEQYKTLWRRPGTENIHLDTEPTCSRRKSPRFSWWIRRVSTNHVFSRLISRCRCCTRCFLVHFRRLHFPPSRWTKSQTLHAEGRIISYSTVIYWRHQSYSYNLGCIARKPHRWLLEHRWSKRLVRFMDRFHTICLIEGKASRRIHVVQGETNETASNIQTWSFVARNLDKYVRELQNEGETLASEIPKLENARKLGGIYFIDLEDKEFPGIIKNARKKLEVQAAPVKGQIAGTEWPVPKKMITNPNWHENWKHMNPKYCVWMELSQEFTKTILQGKVTIHCTITIWYTNLLYDSSDENTGSERSSGQRLGKTWEKIVESGESQKQIWSDRRSQTQRSVSTFRNIDWHVSSEEFWVGEETAEV